MKGEMIGFEFFVEEEYGENHDPVTRVACQCGDFGWGIYCRGHNLSELEIENMKLIARAKVWQAMEKVPVTDIENLWRME